MTSQDPLAIHALTVDALIAEARRAQTTPEQAEEQRRSFAYGNVAIDHPEVTRAHVDAAAITIAPARVLPIAYSEGRRVIVCRGRYRRSEAGERHVLVRDRGTAVCGARSGQWTSSTGGRRCFVCEQWVRAAQVTEGAVE